MSAVATVAINVDARDATSQLRQVQSQSQATERAVEQLQAGVTGVNTALSRSGRELQTAANGMRFFIDAAGRARKENGQFVTTAEAAAAGIRNQGRAAAAATGQISGLSLAVGRLVTVAAAIQAARFVFAKTAELETQTKSLQVLTGSAEKAKSIIQDLQRLGAVTPFTSTELIDAAKRLQAFGIEANKVVETTKRLADVSGATGAELQGLVTAYGQVQAKGRLQGEELLQFQERGISLQKELQKMYGMTGEEFQKALGKGQISAKAVEVAIQRMTDAGGKYANGAIAQSDTLAGKFSTLQDGIEGIARQVGTVLTPAIKAVLNEAIYAINTINDLMATGARAKSFGMGQGQQQRLFAQAGTEAEQIINLRNIKDSFERNKQFLQLREQRFKDLIESYGYSTGQIKAKATPPAGSTAAVIPPLLGGTRGAGGTRGGKTGGGAGGAELPAYIPKDQLRQWLISQGFGRTTGDFTNRGHATPNHMLNAMDMGILGGSDAEALRRTSAMERRLRATGAFGDQLFGPLSDPRGHGAGKGGRNIHLHIPTPGGMVKMNPALAALMGIKGAGQGGQFALAQGMADEDAKRLQLIEDSFRTGQQIEQQQNRQLANLQAQTPLEQSLLKIQQDYEDRAASISQLLDANQKKKLEGQSAALRELEIIKAQTDNLYRQAGLQKDITSEIGARAFAGAAGTFRTDINLDPLATTDPITEYSQRLKDLMGPINQAKAGAESIGAAFNDAFSGIITGTQTTQEALSNFFKSIADSFLQMASQMIAEMIKVYIFKQITGIFGISGGGGGLFSGAGPVSGASVFSSGAAAFNPAAFGAGVALRATGGPVTAGQSYVVGERGPELFTPSSGGMITPNNRAGGGGVAVTVNVDAKGTSAEGSDQQANQLGRVIAAAVQAELIKQQRRGGILNS